MVAFAVNTSKNWDSVDFSLRTGPADVYTIAFRARLTIDTDTRYCANSDATKGSMGTLNLNTSQGGELYIDGSKVRLIPFSGGAGTAPAIGDTISQGAVSAYCLGVWSAFNVAPVFSPTAMPASGYIKVKNVVGGTFSAGALTGIGATATGADTVGWIEVIGTEGYAINVYGGWKVTTKGEWFEHSTLVTDGNTATTYQLPASLANTYYAGIWVESAVVGVFEFYPAMGTVVGVGTVGTDQVRGKVCWISSQGLVRLGYDGTNLNGYIPPAGRRIRVPNINLINAPAATPTTNTPPNATVASRFKFGTLYNGDFDIDKVNCSWYLLLTSARLVSITNSAVSESIGLQYIGRRATLTNVGVGQSAVQAITGLVINACPYGMDITDCCVTRATNAAAYIILVQMSSGVTFTRCRSFMTQAKTSGSYGVYIIYGYDIVLDSCTLAMGTNYLAFLRRVTITNTTYFDILGGTTNMAGFSGAIFNCAAVEDATFDNIHFGGLTMVASASSLVQLSQYDNKNIVIRNIGSKAAPLNLGGPTVTDAAWAHTTLSSVATVTSVAHGLKTGDYVVINVSSDPSVIPIGAPRQIIVTGPDTWTLVALGGAATSGTVEYWAAIAGYSIISNSSPLQNSDVTIQRVYVTHGRTNTFPITSVDNFRFRLDNVWADGAYYQTVATFGQQDSVQRGCLCHVSSWATLATAGTHFLDYYFGYLSPTLTGTWTRVGGSTTIVCTLSNHGMITNDGILVNASSDPLALPQGVYTVTALNSYTFLVTGLNAGATSGTFTMENLASAVAVLMNEPSVATQSRVKITGGVPTFSGTGSVGMTTTGDEITYEMHDYILGHTGFPNMKVVTNNLDDRHWIDYQIDLNDGNGYSAWKTLHRPYGCSGSLGAYTIGTPATAIIAAGDYVSGVGIAYGAYVVSVDSTTQCTLSAANTASLTGYHTFRHHPNEVIDSTRGFKMKVKDYVWLGASFNSYIFIYTKSTEASRAVQYPLGGAVYQYPMVRTNPPPRRLMQVPLNSRPMTVPQRSTGPSA